MGRYEPRDHYFKKAKREGFAARSIYKLEEIDRAHKVLARGMNVLDLGASPGSWTQYASKTIGERGTVVAIDLKPLALKGPVPANVRPLQGDAFATPPEALRAHIGGGDFDVVLSDMAPATMGDRFVDQQRSTDLCHRALDLAEAMLRQGGHFVVKALEGESTKEVMERVKKTFVTMKVVRPDSVRKGSTEIFIIGRERKTRPTESKEG